MKGRRANTIPIRTPEGVVFPLLLACPVSRCLAWSVDFAAIGLLSGLSSTLLGILSIVGRDAARASLVVSYFLLSVGYHIVLEWRWKGQTLGKRLLHLRVMDEQGLAINFNQIIIRNLVRAVDILPGFFFVGGLTSLLSDKAQRLGDIAAGTIVVRHPPAREPDLRQILSGKYNSFRDYPHLAARLRQRVAPDEAHLALNALLRRGELDPQARVEIYREIAARFRSVQPFPEAATYSLTDEQYLRNVVDVLFRSRD